MSEGSKFSNIKTQAKHTNKQRIPKLKRKSQSSYSFICIFCWVLPSPGMFLLDKALWAETISFGVWYISHTVST